MRVLLAALLLAVVAGAVRAEQLADGIAAQVGSDIVLISDVMEAAAPTAARKKARRPSRRRACPSNASSN